MVSPDIRAGVSLLIASLAADGESTIHNVEQIDRGYQDIDKRLFLGQTPLRLRETAARFWAISHGVAYGLSD